MMLSSNSATAVLPFIYRFIIITIEPLCAVIGSILVLRDPAQYGSMVTRHALTFAPDTTFLYTALGGSWLYFAFIEAVVMRLTDDLFLWRVLCAGMLISDFWFVHSMAQAVGGWGVYSNLALWTEEDWACMVGTGPMLLTRILIVLGIGFRHTTKSGRGGKIE